jgi:hypothetical protein
MISWKNSLDICGRAKKSNDVAVGSYRTKRMGIPRGGTSYIGIVVWYDTIPPYHTIECYVHYIFYSYYSASLIKSTRPRRWFKTTQYYCFFSFCLWRLLCEPVNPLSRELATIIVNINPNFFPQRGPHQWVIVGFHLILCICFWIRFLMLILSIQCKQDGGFCCCLSSRRWWG